MENKNTNNILKPSLIRIILSICLTIIITAVGTYAWLSYQGSKVAMVLTISDMNKVTITLKPYQIDANISPMLTYTSLDDNEEYITVKAENNESVPRYFGLYYNIDSIDTELRNSNFKYTIVRTNDNNVIEGNFSGASSGRRLYIFEEMIPENTTYYYKVYFWLYGDEDQTNTQGKKIKGELRATLVEPDSLSAVIAAKAIPDNISSQYVTSSTGINFSLLSGSTNGKGVYLRSETENDDYPIYYYRGDVNDNNVLFGGFCWKIVRTTDTGGVKLIYNGYPSYGQCNNRTGTSTQLSTTSQFNTSSMYLSDVGYMYGTRYSYTYRSPSSNNYVYGSDFTYNGSSYSLKNTYAPTGSWSSKYNLLSNYHYTCFLTSAASTCQPIYYIFYTTTSYAYYIPLTGGKSIDDAINDMFANTNNSNIKTAIDNWYRSNLTSYTDMLEDTIWCNDRSIYNYGGWNANGGSTISTNYYLYFDSYRRAASSYSPSLTCPNKNDSFTMNASNGNGKLTYPVGLLTSDELMLAGARNGSDNSSFYLYTGQSWFTMSPYYYTTTSYNYYFYSSLTYGTIGSSYGVRPVVSLARDVKINDGDGTSGNPYTLITF